MARTELPNGIILPAEYSDDWYDDMTSNLSKLDEVIGSDADKLSAEDVGAAALSNDYDDLDNKPSIPTKTSDLTNDSNFVDNTDPAVASGITSAKVTDYDTHLANTDIHVTTADKTKWNNGVKQAYVLRYSSTAITDNSTIAYSTLDNTDNIKASDKIIDTDGKIFSIVSVDSDNSTVTVGSALIDLALDANVMHLSGNETASGVKTFSSLIGLTGYPSIRMYLSDDEWNVLPATVKQSEFRFTDKNSVIVSYFVFQHRNDNTEPFRTCWRQQKMDGTSGYFSVNFNNLGDFYPENNNVITLGKPANKWKVVYATNYYYGVDNVEFSNKFVTTDTAQTVSGQKVFDDINAISNTAEIGVSGGNNSFKVLDKNQKILARIDGGTLSTGMVYSQWLVNNGTDVFNGVSLYQPSANLVQLRPYYSTLNVQLGASNRYFTDCYTSKINGLVPSSLSLPVIDRTKYVDISGYFTNTGNGDINTYSVTANGWIYLRLTDIDGCQLSVLDSSNNRLYGSTSSGNLEQLCLPVTAGTVVETQWTTSTSVTVAIARFIPCQGNV